jgi:Zn-dependent protease with chaperone function
VGRSGRWWVAGLVTLAAVAVFTWVSGAFVLPALLASSGERWAVASGIGVAVAAFVALWGQWWATQADAAAREATGNGDTRASGSQVTASGNRAVALGRDNTGNISTGDGAVTAQGTTGRRPRPPKR